MTRPDSSKIEPRFKDSIDHFIKDGIPTGGFLYAVMTNDLKESIKRADDLAIDNIPHIVSYLYNDCPSICWGSVEKIYNWELSKRK